MFVYVLVKLFARLSGIGGGKVEVGGLVIIVTMGYTGMIECTSFQVDF